MMLPPDALRSQLLKASPGIDEATLEKTLRYFVRLKDLDPLAVLQDDSLAGGKKGGQLNLMKLAPNFETAMYVAQATSACTVTDSVFRWSEIKTAIHRENRMPSAGHLESLAQSIESTTFAFLRDPIDIATFNATERLAAYPAITRNVFNYLSNIEHRGPKRNKEAHLNSHFVKTHGRAQAAIKKARVQTKQGRISCVFPPGGIKDNTVNRLLLMSSSEMHLLSVPMALFIEEHGRGRKT